MLMMMITILIIVYCFILLPSKDFSSVNWTLILHSAPQWRKRGAKILLPPYIPSWRGQRKPVFFYFPFTFFMLCLLGANEMDDYVRWKTDNWELSTETARRSQWPRCLRRGSAAARLVGLWVRIPPGACLSVCWECCVLSGRGLCDELITRPEESYRLWCVVVCDSEGLIKRRS